MKFLILCILLGTSLALVEKRQYGPGYDNKPLVVNGPAPNDDDAIQVQASRYRRNINANIIEIREAPAKSIAIGLPPPLLNFDEGRMLRDESNEEIPTAERNETDYGRNPTIGEA